MKYIKKCQGCKSEFERTNVDRLCSECNVLLYEWLAKSIDPSYDPLIYNCWSEVEEIISRLYGKDWMK